MKPLRILSMSFLTGLSGAMMPGPVLAITITAVLQFGFIAAVLIAVGHSLLELVLVAALALGLKNFLRNRFVTGFIGIVGGSVLLWFAYGMISSVFSGITAPGAASMAGTISVSKIGLVGKGAIVTLSNPYWIIWWVTIGITYLMVSLERDVVGISAFFVGHISSDFVWYCAVAAALVLGKQLISDRIYKGIILLCGLFLVCLGIYFFYSGVRKFLQKPQVQESAASND